MSSRKASLSLSNSLLIVPGRYFLCSTFCLFLSRVLLSDVFLLQLCKLKIYSVKFG